MSRRVNRFAALAILAGSLAATAFPELSLDSERLNLETRMQQRVESALAKILPAGQFVVVIRVEPMPAPEPARGQQNNAQGFYLPGVPVRQRLDNSDQQVAELVETLKPDNAVFTRFIRRMAVTLVLDNDLKPDMVDRVRELTRQMLSLDPARGDTLDIQRTAFNKTSAPAELGGMSRLQSEVRSYWTLIILVLIIFCVAIFFLFMFGPLRGFLNNFVQVLPTLRPAEIDRGRMPEIQAMPAYSPPLALGASPASFSGSLQVENPNKTMLPFGFIREDHLPNLAILLSREAPEKAAVVLGYLPPEWISRVLARLEPGVQTDVAGHLATTRQLLPEQVEDIEQDLKRRLDYLVGGPERIYAIYESLEPEAQKRMLDSLRESRPELAEELRQRTIMFEDLEKLESPALKALLREVDLQTIVMSLRGTADGFKARILEHVPAGKAEIIREEMELGDGTVGKATADARRKMIGIAKRLERDGQIHIPQIEESIPTTRYGASLRSTLKLPPGLKLKDDGTDGAEPGPDITKEAEATAPDNIRDKIRRFMSRRPDADGGNAGGE